MDFKGVITALVSPFKDGKIDRDSFYKLLQRQAEAGISHFVLNGTTGESPTLEVQDLKLLVRCFRDFERQSALSFQLMIGAGTFCTKTSLEKCQLAEQLGANSLLIVSPYYNKPCEQGLKRHYETLAANTSLPILLYHVPARGCFISYEVISHLSQIDNIKGIKEASGDVDFFKQLTSLKNFTILSGDDFTFVRNVQDGGSGVISAASNVAPRLFRKFYELAKADNSAEEQFKKYSNLLKQLYERTNPLQIKQALKYLKILNSAETRLPLFNPDSRFPELEQELNRLSEEL